MWKVERDETGKLHRFRSWRIKYAMLKDLAVVLYIYLKSFRKETDMIRFSIYEANSGYMMKNRMLRWETGGSYRD